MNHTKGPWHWVQAERAGGIYLATPDRGHLIVMDFVRQGMQSGQPRFATWKGEDRECMGGIMRPAEMLDVASHPDARLIAAAPELLAACKALQMEAAARGCGLRIADEAIAKAEGGFS